MWNSLSSCRQVRAPFDVDLLLDERIKARPNACRPGIQEQNCPGRNHRETEITPGWNHGQHNLLRGGANVSVICCHLCFWGLVLTWQLPFSSTPPNFHSGGRESGLLVRGKNSTRAKVCITIFNFHILNMGLCVFVEMTEDGDGDPKFGEGQRFDKALS